MTKKEREQLEWMIEHYISCVKAYKEKNINHLFTTLNWLGHNMEKLINEDPQRNFIFDIKLIWKADPEEL